MYQKIVNKELVGSTPLPMPGVSIRILSQDAVTGGMAVLTSMDAGATIPEHWHTKADETVYVLEGDFVEAGVSYGPGTFFAGKAGTAHGPHHSVGGCTVLTHFSAELDFNLVKPASETI
jgi:anti-sigma factor ChrR (cupin superfamily)